MARSPRPSPLYHAIALLSWPALRVAFRLRWTGREHVPDGGCVLAANHWSNFDPWPLGIPLYPHRFLRFMAKKELYWRPLKWIVDAGGGFPVDRGKRDQQAIDTAVELCRAGHAVVMFPEGTRRSKGLRKKLRGALAHRRGADCALGGRAARSGRDLGHGAPEAPRSAARRVRPADRDGRPRWAGGRRSRLGGDGAPARGDR